MFTTAALPEVRVVLLSNARGSGVAEGGGATTADEATMMGVGYTVTDEAVFAFEEEAVTMADEAPTIGEEVTVEPGEGGVIEAD